MSALKPGVVVAGRYRTERSLGQGGMGEVWSAVHLVTGKQVALKVLKAEKAARPEAVRRFLREARAATVVGHANVVEVHDVFSFEGAPLMVMELLAGESLAQHLRRVGRLPLPALADLLRPVVSAVGTAHARGIVHRDLKPENIFLAEVPHGGQIPKVLDFGVAKLSFDELEVEAAALTRTGSMVGTPFYMAPEQAGGERDLDYRCDIWALGVICFEALVGKRPFEGENFGQIFKRILTEQPASLGKLVPGLPKPVADAIDGMLDKERTARTGLAEVMKALAPHSSTRAPDFGAPLSVGVVAAGPQRAAAPLVALDTPTLEDAPPSSEERLLGTLDATTVGRPETGRGRGSLKLVGGALVLGTLALAAAATLRTAPGEKSGGAPSASTAPPQEPSPAASTPVLVAPNGSAAVAPSSSGRARLLRGTSRSPAKPKVEAAGPKPLPAESAPVAAKKLPGGILDQDQAPF